MDKGTVAIALAGGALGLSLYNYVRGRRAVVTTGATGFYNGAQVKGGIVYASGQVAVCGKTADGKPMLKPGGVKAESRQCLENLAKILGDAGSGLDAVLKTTCYLGDISMYADFNEGARARARCDPRRSRVLSRGAQYWRLCHAFEVARCASRSSRAPQSTSSSSRTPRRARRACASPSTSCRWARSSRSNARRT